MKRQITLFAATILFSIAAFAQNARVQIIHNSADAAASVVDVWLDNTKILDSLQFREASPFINAPAGVSFDIRIKAAGSSDTINPVFLTSFNLPANDTFVVVANGILSTTGYSPAPAFGLDVFALGKEAATSSTVTEVLVYHGSTDAPTVDVFESSVPAGTIVNDISYGQFQGYLGLTTADYDLQIRNQNNSAIVAAYNAPLSTLTLGGEAIVVLASGFLNPAANSNGPAFGLYAALASGGPLVALPVDTIPTARVQAIHNSADLAAEYVDVYYNETLLLDNFQFRNASPFVDVQAGVDFELSIADSASSDTTTAIVKFTYNLQEDSTYILIANGIVSPTGYSPATPFNIDVFGSARETAVGGMMTTDVLVYHGATDAPAVDVNETSVPAGLIVDSITYSDYAGYLGLSTADYVLDINLNSNAALVGTYSAPLSTLGLGGQAITVLASGFVTPASNSNGPAFGLWVALSSGGALVPLSNITSLNEIDAALNSAINLYPNPSNGNVQLSFDNLDELPRQMDVIDLNGRVVREISVENQNTQTLNLQDLSRGTYLVRFIGNNGVAVKRIIIQ